MPSPSAENSRRRIEGNSSAIRFGVVHLGSRNMEFEGGPAARCESSLANAETISLAAAAASAGHRKGVKRTKRHRRCNRRPQTVGLPERIVNVADRRHFPLFGKSIPPLIARRCRGHLVPVRNGARRPPNGHRMDLAVAITDLLLIGVKLASAYRRGTMKSLRNGALQCRYSEGRSRVTTSIG
jgi:hypothetical protein